jgi:bifunctional non-homologous end joining protein LigD
VLLHSAALALKNILDQLELESFLMTSGRKGYHIHVPIRAIYTWEQVKKFSESIARKMEEDEPQLYTASLSKTKRRNKIFIDFLRNSRGHTAVAPYSLRATEKFTIAVPISWSLLKKSAPDMFTILNLPKLLRRKDPWAGMTQLKQKILLF